MPDVTQEQLFKLALEIKGQEEMKRLADETGKAGQAVGEYIAKIKDLSAEQMAADPKLRELMQRFQDLGEESTKLKDKIDKLNKDPDAEAGKAFDDLGASVNKILQSGSLQEAGNQIWDLASKIKATPWDVISTAMAGPAGWIAAGTAVAAFMPTLISAIQKFTDSLYPGPLKAFNEELDKLEKKAKGTHATIADVATKMAADAGPPRSDTQKEADKIREGIIGSLSQPQREAFERQNLEIAMGQELADDPVAKEAQKRIAAAKAQIDKDQGTIQQIESDPNSTESTEFYRNSIAVQETIIAKANEALEGRRQAKLGNAQARATRAQREGGMSAAHALWNVGSMDAMAGNMTLRNKFNEFVGATDTARQRVIDQGAIDQQTAAAEASAEIAATAAKDRAEGVKDAAADVAQGARWDDFIDARKKKADQEAKQKADKAKHEADKAQREAEQELNQQAQLATAAFSQNQGAQLALRGALMSGADPNAVARDLAQQLVSPVTGDAAALMASQGIVKAEIARTMAQLRSLMWQFRNEQMAQAQMWAEFNNDMAAFGAGGMMRGRP